MSCVEKGEEGGGEGVSGSSHLLEEGLASLLQEGSEGGSTIWEAGRLREISCKRDLWERPSLFNRGHDRWTRLRGLLS